ncbi:MAG: hypothetical protein ACEY3F_05540, partial [Wolbachia sp.]
MKAPDKDSDVFRYLCNKFPELSYAKVKEGVFTDPQLRKIIADSHFQDLLGGTERDLWMAFNASLEIINLLTMWRSALVRTDSWVATCPSKFI